MKQKIMVVDDAAELRDVLCLYLENAGYEVLKAVDGLDALECLKSHDIDLMILDIMMPNMGGFELWNIWIDKRKTAVSHYLLICPN